MSLKFKARNNFTQRRAILCEGSSDEAFFRSLIAKHNLPPFSIRHTGDGDKNDRGGIDKFEQLLLGIPTWEGFGDLTDIVVVADNDATPTENFKKVQKQIRAAHYGVLEQKYIVPNSPFSRVAGTPGMAVAMLPTANVVGKLETLCLKAAQDAAPAVSACIEAFVACTKTTAWPSPTLDELKLRALLSARHRKNPSVGLGKVWNENPELIPLDNPCFNEIVSFLGSYRT